MTTIEQEIRNLVIGAGLNYGGRPRKLDTHADAANLNEPAGPSEETIAQTIARQERNASFALDRFGFGSLFWPSLQDLADQYDGLGTRERVRQILDRLVFQRVLNNPQAVAIAVAELVEARDFWSETELLEALTEAGYIEGLAYFRGLLDYLQAQSLLVDWEVVQPDMKAVTRQSYEEHPDRFVVKPERRTHLAEAMRLAQKIVCQNGLCTLSHVGIDDEAKAPLLAMLKAHKDAWTTRVDDTVWYAFGDRHNTLLHNATKVFSLVDQCDLQHLSEMLQKSLFQRSSRFKEYPDVSIVREWISRSDYFHVDGAAVTFRGEKTEFHNGERDLIDVMRGQGTLMVGPVRKALSERGHSDANISKLVYHSPLVHTIGGGRGRGTVRITLATDLATPSTAHHDDYSMFRARLDALETTDRMSTATGREEQRILTEWIFRDASHINCAICDREFSRGSIVTAHKKKRAHCTETERRDPNIVFPLCKFGCDHLYERDFVRVIDGRVAPGRVPTGPTEASVIAALVGRKLPTRWLNGPADYFDMTTTGQPIAEARIAA